MATRHYRLGQRHARRGYDPGPYRVTASAAPRSLTALNPHYGNGMAAAKAAAAKAAAGAERSRLYNRPLPTEAEMEEIEMRAGVTRA